MTTEKAGGSNNLDAMKEYLGIEGYTAFLDCIKEHIGPGLYGNEKGNNNNYDKGSDGR